jgi:hypothetical protein
MTIFFKLNNAEFLQHVTQNINKQILILMFYYPNCKQEADILNTCSLNFKIIKTSNNYKSK